MLNVLYGADENYAPYVGISIVSFLDNNYDDFDGITFHIIEYEMSKESKEKISQIIEKYNNCAVNFYSFNLNDYNCHPKQKNFHQIAYARLFVQSIVPKDIEKILYLDVDSVVLGSFKDLIENTELNDYYIAAVEDIVLPKAKKLINLNEKDLYINSGMLLMNLKKLREDNMQEKFLEKVNTKTVKLADQDIFNMVLKGKILKIHPRYNLFEYFYELNYENILKCFSLDEYYTKDIIEYAKENPVFCHSINLFGDDPWTDENYILSDKFKYYASFTSFDNETIYKHSNFPRWKKSLHFLAKKLPQSIFSSIAPIYINNIIDKDLNEME